MKVLVIGAGGTIGRSVKELLEQEHDVVPVGYRAGHYRVDIADKQSIERLFQQVDEIDALISTAGEAAFAPLDELTDDQFALGWNNKLMGQINLLRVGRAFIRPAGVVLLTSGMLASQPTPGSASLSAINGAINAFVKAAALELGDRLRINAVSPVFVKETMEKLGIDSSSGVTAADTAKAYRAALLGRMTGAVLDARDYV